MISSGVSRKIRRRFDAFCGSLAKFQFLNIPEPIAWAPALRSLAQRGDRKGTGKLVKKRRMAIALPTVQFTVRLNLFVEILTDRQFVSSMPALLLVSPNMTLNMTSLAARTHG